MFNYFDREKISMLFHWSYWLLLANIGFLLLASPLLISFALLGANLIYFLPLWIIASIAFSNGFLMLCTLAGTFIRTKNLDFGHDLLHALKTNWRAATLLGLYISIAIYIFQINFHFFFTQAYGFIIIPLFIALAIIFCASLPYTFIILSRFHMKPLQLLRSALICTFLHPMLTIAYVFVLILGLLLFTLAPAVMLLFGAGLIALIYQFISRQLLLDLEGEK